MEWSEHNASGGEEQTSRLGVCGEVDIFNGSRSGLVEELKWVSEGAIFF